MERARSRVPNYSFEFGVTGPTKEICDKKMDHKINVHKGRIVSLCERQYITDYVPHYPHGKEVFCSQVFYSLDNIEPELIDWSEVGI